MASYDYNDSVIVRRYLDDIATFIQKIVHDENVAAVLACEVMVAHKKRERKQPFDTEENRRWWLFLKSRNLSIDYLRHQRNEEIKAQALGKAIHDCS